MNTHAPSCILLSLLLATPLAAQRIADYELVRASHPIAVTRTLPRFGDSVVVHKRSFWLEGGIIGGLITGTIGMGLSSMGDSPTGSGKRALGFLMGAVPGFTIGAFIGDSIKKESDAEEEP